MLTIPQSEQCIIGGILINPDNLKNVRAEIEPSDFLSDRNKYLFQAFIDVSDHGEPISPTSVINNLTQAGQIRKIGGSGYLADIIANVHTSGDWRYHIKQIKNHKLKETLLGISGDIIEGAKGGDSPGLLENIKKRIAEIKTSGGSENIVELADALPSVLEGLEGHKDQGIPTGFYNLNNLIGGWYDSDLIILAGRPGMGKSLLAKDFAEASGAKVLFFSLEMPKEMLIKRQLSNHSNVNFQSIRRSSISESDWPKIIKAADKLHDMSIAYNDKANLSIDELIRVCEARHKKEGLDLIIIDYLQLIRSKEKVEHREREVSAISVKLKGLARSLNVPVICLAQLNRSCETRGGDKKPMLSDLRESGGIEQDADIVIFIWREAVYKKSAPKNEALLIVAKGRNTMTGVVPVYFDGSRQVFRNRTREV